MKNFKLTRLLKCIISIVILVFIDQFTKAWAVKALENKPSIDLIKGVLEFYYLPNGNTGAAFGMLQGKQWLFMIIAAFISILLLIIIYNIPFDKKYNILIILMTLIISGGIGNMFDRIRLNYVIDFIYFSIIDFPIFNVADMYVSVGTALLVIVLLFYYKEEDLSIIESNIKCFFKGNKL